jgi:hypothetical protein
MTQHLKRQEMESNLTSVEWLESQLTEYLQRMYKSEIEQAKEMEKQQIIDAYNENENYMCDGTEGEQYYNEKYNK